MRGRRTRAGALALLLALAALPLLAGCGGSDFSDFTGDLKFGDEQVADTQVTDVMQVPNGGLGKLIGDAQIEWVRCGQGRGCSGTKDTSRELMKRQPYYQCMALSNTSQAESPTQGTWNWDGGRHACVKTRKLSWLERTLWGMYRKQSQGTIEWLTTSRNTLKADSQGVATLRANASPNYSSWDTNVNRYLKVAQGILVVAAAISLMVVGARLVWSIGGGASGGDGQLLGKIGWIFLGVFLGSSCASIALTFFAQASNSDTGRTPGMQSWSPGSGTGFFLSDWVRLQVDPFLLIAAVAGVLAAGFRLVTMQEGRGLIPLGKAFVTAMLTSVCLAGAVDLFQGTVDEWTAGVLRDASSMMNDAWQHNMLAASQFFALDGPLALLLTIVVWVCSMVSKIFCYLRAGMLPILVGVAPMGGDELDGVGPSGVLPDYGLAGRVPLVQAGRRVGHGNRMRDHEHRRCERRQRGHHADADDQHNRPVAGDGQARSPGGRFKRRRRRAGAHGRCLGRYRRCQRDTCRQGDDGRRESGGRKLAQRVQIRRHATGGEASGGHDRRDGSRPYVRVRWRRRCLAPVWWCQVGGFDGIPATARCIRLPCHYRRRSDIIGISA